MFTFKYNERRINTTQKKLPQSGGNFQPKDNHSGQILYLEQKVLFVKIICVVRPICFDDLF